jgi:hypothetical protein
MIRALCIGVAAFLGVTSLHAQKTRWGQEMPYAESGVNYPISVHVYGLHLRDCGEGVCASILFADVVSNRQKLELECASQIPDKPVPLSFGDFRARLLKGNSGFALGDEYELVLPSKRVARCVVSGMLE